MMRAGLLVVILLLAGCAEEPAPPEPEPEPRDDRTSRGLGGSTDEGPQFDAIASGSFDTALQLQGEVSFFLTEPTNATRFQAWTNEGGYVDLNLHIGTCDITATGAVLYAPSLTVTADELSWNQHACGAFEAGEHTLAWSLDAGTARIGWLLEQPV